MAQPQPPTPPPPRPRRGIQIEVGNPWVAAGVVVVIVGILAIGYFSVVAVFDVPWYAAVPLTLLASAGIVVRFAASSWKAWLLGSVLVLLAGASALGWALR